MCGKDNSAFASAVSKNSSQVPKQSLNHYLIMNSTIQIKKWVILVGIDFYVDKDARLKGCVQDVEDVEKFLNDRYQNTNITTFLARVTGDSEQMFPAGEKSSWPTFENITTKLRRITKQASSGDFVYIHYSGHGALRDTRETKFRKYHNSDSTDSAIVLFDEDRGSRYLRGFQLAGLLNGMVEKGLIVTIVLDCCHSGGVTRGDAHFRGLAWDDDRDFQDESNFNNMLFAESNERNDGNHRNGHVDEHWLLKPRNYTLFAACGSLEKAEEHLFETGKFHGVFTFILLQSLKSSGFPKSHKRIHRELCIQFHATWPAQHPVLFGNFDALLFGNNGIYEVCSDVS